MTERERHSFDDSNGKRWTACCECNRGGNGNDPDKCSCGWKCVDWNGHGCYLGTAIVGEIKPRPKVSRSKQRYQRYLDNSDCFDSFRDFLEWDGEQAKQELGA